MAVKARKRRRRPRIGITKPDDRLWVMWWANRLAIKLAGGKPVKITPRNMRDLEGLDGLLLTGGDDIHPSLYQQEAESSRTYDHERDTLEQQLCREALERDIPILGICRGAQMINIVLGGSLHADNSSIFEEVFVTDTLWAKIFWRKPVLFEPGTHLRRALNQQRLRVNSMHHQSVDTLGAGLVVSAKEPNGIVQGIEHPGKRFALGIQWHPEFLTYNLRHRLLFRAFVRAARNAHDGVQHQPG